jgi:hypothetical protein
LRGVEIRGVDWARHTDSARPNVEGEFATSDGLPWLVEHTLIEAYTEQTSKGIKFERLAPLIEEIDLGVPDVALRIALAHDYDAHLRSAAADRTFVRALTTELRRLATVMAPGERAWAAIGPVNLIVSRRKHPHPRPVWALRVFPAPVGATFTDLVRERLAKKAKKFVGRSGQKILILEVESLAMDMNDVKEAALAAEMELAAYDDVIVLETDRGAGPWFAYALRLGGRSTEGDAQEIPIVDSDINLLRPESEPMADE